VVKAWKRREAVGTGKMFVKKQCKGAIIGLGD
jgi:hypothetical protein